MDNVNSRLLNDDENARDEFSAKALLSLKRNAFCDIMSNNGGRSDDRDKNTFGGDVSLDQSRKEVLVNRRRVLGDISNVTRVNSNETQNVAALALERSMSDRGKNTVVPFKRQRKESGSSLLDELSKLRPQNKNRDRARNSGTISVLRYVKNTDEEGDGSGSDSDTSHVEIVKDHKTLSLMTPMYGYSAFYRPQITYAVANRTAMILSHFDKDERHLHIMNTVVRENKVLVAPCRKECTPLEEYVVSDRNQYVSKCLIKQHRGESFKRFADSDHFFQGNSNSTSSNSSNLERGSINGMREYLNYSVMSDLYQEKLHGNKFDHFLPRQNYLSGSIIGGFINRLFEMSNRINLSSRITHLAIEYLYLYLSRTDNVTLSEITSVMVGGASLAIKTEGLQKLDEISRFFRNGYIVIKHAELRLLMVLDFDVIRPTVVNFRNRYIAIEECGDDIDFLSQFILDMTVHCYNFMMFPASQRAAASVWLSRLISKLNNIGHQKYSMGFQNQSKAREIMEDVWSDKMTSLSGYEAAEIASLALRMHIVVLALLCEGQDNNPSISACFEKYLAEQYGQLSRTYEPRTNPVVYYGAILYCRVNDITPDDLLEENEYRDLVNSATNVNDDFSQQTTTTTTTTTTRSMKWMMDNSGDDVSSQSIIAAAKSTEEDAESNAAVTTNTSTILTGRPILPVIKMDSTSSTRDSGYSSNSRPGFTIAASSRTLLMKNDNDK